MRESDVLVRLEDFSDLPFGSTSVVLMADGRLVTRTSDGRLVQRILTPSGVQRVRDEIFGTGLFAKDLHVGLEPGPVPIPPGQGHGFAGIRFKAWSGARTVDVSTILIQSGEEQYYARSEARDRLVSLARELREPETWLPATAWSEASPRWFAPAAFRAYVVARPRTPGDVYSPPRDLDAIDWPFTAALPDMGEPTGNPRYPEARCIALTSDDATGLRTELERIGAVMPAPSIAEGAWSAALISTSRGLAIDVFTEALWPDETSCVAGHLR